jgi:hypothetical protein
MLGRGITATEYWSPTKPTPVGIQPPGKVGTKLSGPDPTPPTIGGGQMKVPSSFIVATFIVITVLTVTTIILLPNNSNFITSVEKGQLWVYKPEDPFSSICKTYRVIDVADGYVQYEDISTGRISSSSIRWFKTDSLLLEVGHKSMCREN